MVTHQFYFRCKACNRFLNGHSKRWKNGKIEESDLCSYCASAAFDTSVEKQYEHQVTTDFLSFYQPSDEEKED